MTNSKIAIPLKVGAAMAAEIAGVCVLTSILDLILCMCLSVQKRQSTNQSNPEQLTDSACSFDYPKCLSHDVEACLWTTLRVLVTDSERVIDDHSTQPSTMTAETWKECKDSMDYSNGRSWRYHGMNNDALRTRSSVVHRLWRNPTSPIKTAAEVTNRRMHGPK